jgi:transposase-like protein
MTGEFDFTTFKAHALEGLNAGHPLTGKDGVLGPLLENLLNAALEGEMDAHMSSEERESGNSRNGYGTKQVQSSLGEITVQTPRDRDATFDPQVIKKRERILADSFADRIIGLYAAGTSAREISDLMEEQFGNRISAETVSATTDRVFPELQSWRNRSLDAVCPIVWLDAIHYKVMDDKNRPVSRAIYNVLGLCADGRKDLLGMYIAKSEGANFWLSALTDLQNRGVRDILIACVDGLKGFPDAIASVFPQTSVQ